MPLNEIPNTYRGMKRLKQIATVFMRHGFYDAVSRVKIQGISNLLSRWNREQAGQINEKTLSAAQRLRMAFEELGPTFIKLGQMLSLEPDIIPPEFVEEFKKLQDEVPPFSFEEVQEIIESELGDKPEKFFEYLEPKAIAAASIAQVHIGRLFSGEKVAVKLQRPNIEEAIREDIKIMMRVARTMENRIDNMELLNPVAIVVEFENFIIKELDFTNEAASADRFANNFKDDPTICIPKVFWDFTTPRIMVMEHLDGVAMNEVEKMRDLGLDPKEIAQIGLNAFSKQILEHGYFHADAHPGNSLAMPDGRVGIIDFGIMGFIDNEMMRNLANIFVGYAEHDYDQLITVFINMGLISDEADLKSFKYDLMDISEPFYGRSLKYVRVRKVFDKVIFLAMKYQIRLPRELILLFKTMIGLESIGKTLSPEANILETMKPYAARFLEKSFSPKAMMGSIRHDFFKYSNVFRNYPDLLNKILSNLALGNQNITINLKIDRLEEIERNYIHNSKRLALGVVAGTSAMAAAWILASENQFFPVSIPLLGAKDIPLTSLIGIIGFCVATFLGIWLAFTIVAKSN